MGMQEHLSVNIFQGVLPSAYLFVDDGSNPELWDDVTFDYLEASGDYGYYGKGLRLGIDDSVAGTGRSGSMQRRCLNSPIQTFWLGFLVRPYCLGAGATWPVDYGPYFSVTFSGPTLVGGSTQRFSVSVWPKFDRIMFRVIGTNVAEIRQSVPSLVSLPPWISIRLFVDGSNAKVLQVNNQSYTINVPLSYPDVICQYSYLQIQAEKPNDGIRTVHDWHLDQIWMSESENLV